MSPIAARPVASKGDHSSTPSPAAPDDTTAAGSPGGQGRAPESRLLLLSAADATALAQRIEDIKAHASAGTTDLADVAYTLVHGRRVFEHSAALLAPASNAPADAYFVARGKRSSVKPAIAFMFPGQGAQFVGMGRQLYTEQPRFRALLDQADATLAPIIGQHLKDLLVPAADADTAALSDTLKQTAIAQPALFVVEYGLAQLLLDYGVEPDVLLGHSIGEFAAACLAGVFDVEAALKLVATRGQLMQSMPAGTMLAVFADPAAVQDLCGDGVDLAAHNAPGVTVLSGPPERVARVSQQLEQRGLKTQALHTSHAFHSAMMEPILEPFAEAVRQANPQPPQRRIISTMTAQLLTPEQATSPEYWAQQLRNAVRFADAASLACDLPERVLVEVGPGVSLSTSVGKVAATGSARPRKVLDTLGHPKAELPAMEAVLRCLGQLWVQGADLAWDRLYPSASSKLVRLPTYPYTRARHWVDPPAHQSASYAGAFVQTASAAPANDASSEEVVSQRVVALLSERLGTELSEDDYDRTFLELGFDSLALSQLVAKLRQTFSLRVPVKRLFEDLNTPRLLAAIVAQEGEVAVAQQAASAQAHAAAIAGSTQPLSAPGGERALEAVMERLASIERHLKQLTLQERGGAEPAALGVSDTSDLRELTGSQREIWVAVKVGGEAASLGYNECRSFRFQGSVNESALRACLDDLSLRHEALRQSFSADGEYCITHRALKLTLVEEDLRTLPQATRTERLAALHHAAVATPFDLEQGPLWRGTLVRFGPQQTHLILCAHHIVVDGSSWGVLIRELAALYSARVDGQAPTLPEATPFSSYAEGLAQYDRSPEARQDEAFWLDHLRGQIEDLSLPTDRARPAQRSFRASRLDHRLSADTTARIRQAASAAACTPQSYVLAAFQVLLHRLSRQRDLVIGIPTSGQAAGGFDSLVGHCVHVLPLRTLFDPQASLGEHLRALHANLLDGLDHQRATFTDIMHALQRPRDPSRATLIQVAFGMGRSQKRPQLSGLDTWVHVPPRVSESFELYVYLTADDDGLEVSWSFNTDLFSRESITAWQRCFEATIASFLQAQPDAPLCDLAVLSNDDQGQLLALARGPKVVHEPHVPAHRAIAAHAASTAGQRRPRAIAIRDGNGDHSYAELDALANRTARYLLSLDARHDRTSHDGSTKLVGVCLERSFELVATLLGVWRAGYGYIPLDPAYPAQRIEMILEDSAASLVVTSRTLRGCIPEHTHVVCLDDVANTIASQSASAPEIEDRPEATAYVIFTSGSTGRPKGVQIPQRAVSNFLEAMAKSPGFNADDRLLAITTISFDISVLELFLPLTRGGAVTIATRDQALDPLALSRLLAEHGITVMQATPATWQMLFDAGWGSHPRLKVLCGGEALPQHLAERLLASCGEVWNVYGPTETTVWSSCARVTDASGLTIGTPIDNTTMYVLDDQLALAPPGAHGELWIGGLGVADGYLGRPELTAERFIDSPFEPGDRIYRTGDLARLRQDGQFECLGRVDTQVKIRGFRIELGEIESAAVAHPDVASCVAVARDDDQGEKLLVAYLVAEAGAALDADALRDFLAERLPPYMMPNAFSVLEALPMTPNNKVDRKALPAPTLTPPSIATRAVSGRPAKDALEADVLNVFREFLKHPGLRPDDNFFSVGGHSLLAIRIVQAIEQRMSASVPVNVLLAKPTVMDLSNWIREHRAETRAAGQRPAPMLGTHHGLFKIQDGDGTGVPLLLIHGDHANTLLTPELSTRQEVWGYHHQGSEGDRLMFETVESLAQHCLDEWVAEHGQRPCMLSGHSYGALIAFHVAVLRQRAGLPTPRVILLDARNPEVLTPPRVPTRPRQVAAVLREHLGNREAHAARKAALDYLDRGERVPEDMRSPYVLATYRLATRRYHPPRYEGDLDVIRSEEWVRLSPSDGWKRAVSGQVHTSVVHSTHLNLVRSAEGIKEIGRYIQRICAELNAHEERNLREDIPNECSRRCTT